LSHLLDGSAAAAGAILLGVIYVGSGFKYRMAHYLWLGGFSAALGAWAYLRNDSIAFVILWQGVASAVVGGIRLWRFIESHPRPVESEA
jgi:hypothetical protein